jgi:hypothetical protein
MSKTKALSTLFLLKTHPLSPSLAKRGVQSATPLLFVKRRGRGDELIINAFAHSSLFGHSVNGVWRLEFLIVDRMPYAVRQTFALIKRRQGLQKAEG